MVYKFILLTSFCLTYPGGETKCGQYLRDDLSDATECRSMAKAIGTAQKRKIEGLGGSMASYNIFCYAIDNQGMDIDQSFEISYNIL
jgi:2-methylaconitate cis-trans-isomerase PrpF